MSPLSIYIGIGVLVLVVQLILGYMEQKTFLTDDQIQRVQDVFSPLPSEWVPVMTFLTLAIWMAVEVVLWPYYCGKELYFAIKHRKNNACSVPSQDDTSK